MKRWTWYDHNDDDNDVGGIKYQIDLQWMSYERGVCFQLKGKLNCANISHAITVNQSNDFIFSFGFVALWESDYFNAYGYGCVQKI